jgi:hypothetical protein
LPAPPPLDPRLPRLAISLRSAATDPPVASLRLPLPPPIVAAADASGSMLQQASSDARVRCHGARSRSTDQAREAVDVRERGQCERRAPVSGGREHRRPVGGSVASRGMGVGRHQNRGVNGVGFIKHGLRRGGTARGPCARDRRREGPAGSGRRRRFHRWR